jgi:hypothetical protein
MRIIDKSKLIELEEPKIKTIHGHVDITLKNVKTGMVDRISGDNAFQATSLQHWMRKFGDLNVVAPSSFADMVGGLLLFKNPITVGNRYMPAGNEMIGHGYRGSVTQGAYPYLGTFNETESAADNDEIVQVWDFATNQANGRISCVSLTSSTGGCAGYGGNSRFGGEYGGVSIRSGQSSVESYDGVGNGGYYNGWYYWLAGYTDGVLSIGKSRRSWVTGSVFSGQTQYITFNMSDVGNPWNLDFATLSKFVWGDVGNGKFRFAYSGGVNVAAGGNFYYYEFDAANESLTLKTLINSSADTIRVQYESMIFFDNLAFACVPVDYGMANVYIFDCETNELIDQLNQSVNSWRSPYDSTDRASWDNMPGQLSDGLFLFSSQESGYSGRVPKIYDIVNKTLKNINFSAGMGSSGQTYGIGTRLKTLDGLMMIRMYYRPYRFHNPLYLATIYNLSSPVDKTAAHTMKVTYTLREE